MIQLDNLEPKLGRNADHYLWADFVEINCLQNTDGQVSLSEVLREHWASGVGLAGNFQPTDDELCEDGIDSDDPNDSVAELDERYSGRLRDLISHLEVRNGLFREAYPFAVDADSGFVQLKEPRSETAFLYVFFLMASNLRFFSRATRGNLTSDFECLCAYALKQLLPRSASIKHFGTARNPAFDGYLGNTFAKWSALAVDICAKLKIEQHDLRSTDTGDTGVDLVGWYSFGDSSSHMPLYIAQCGCTGNESDMLCKQDTVGPHKIRNFLDKIEFMPMMFTPQCYRKNDGSWPRPHEIRSIFIDRVRLLRLLPSVIGVTEIAHIPMLNMANQALLRAQD